MDIQNKQIHITKLRLDSENPRHDEIDNQNEVIKQLLKTEQIYNLARDIAIQGSLSPLETIGVLQTGKREFTVIEGNRRVCACLLLNNPDLCPTTVTKKKFERLKSKNSIPARLDCAVFANRDDADHWMQLRHEGQQDGIGTKDWDAKQKARYSAKRGRENPNIQAVGLLDYAVREGIIANEDRDSFSITTLKRYLGNPKVRGAFGLKDGKGLESNHTPDVFNAMVSRFLKDAEDTDKISSRSKKDTWEKYAKILEAEVAMAPASDAPYHDYNSPSVVDDDTPEEKEPEEPVKKTPKKRGKNDPSKRRYLSGDTRFAITEKTLNRVFIELKHLPVEGHEFSVAFLFRAFIERTAFLYLKKHQPGKVGGESKLNQKLKWVSEDLEKDKGVSAKKLKILNVAASSKNAQFSPMVFGMMVHGAYIPEKRELLVMWDRLEDTLLLIHEYL